MSAIVMMRKRMAAAEFLGGDCKPIRMVSGGFRAAEKSLQRRRQRRKTMLPLFEYNRTRQFYGHPINAASKETRVTIGNITPQDFHPRYQGAGSTSQGGVGGRRSHARCPQWRHSHLGRRRKNGPDSRPHGEKSIGDRGSFAACDRRLPFLIPQVGVAVASVGCGNAAL